MRSYNQYCAIAKALDVVGDRWNMLIVRELLSQGACRYTDLLNGLPGIATNLLADRLRDLEREGVVTREEAPPPIATTLFRLTPRGQQLDATLLELARWGTPLLMEPAEQDTYRGRWLALTVSLFVSDRAPDEPPVAVELRSGDEVITVATAEGGVHARPGAAERPDLILTGPPQLLVGVLTGQLDLTTARARGLQTQGSTKILSRLQPEPDGAARAGSA
jgi:DNA-binding HxlR family transcriptional regulator